MKEMPVPYYYGIKEANSLIILENLLKLIMSAVQYERGGLFSENRDVKRNDIKQCIVRCKKYIFFWWPFGSFSGRGLVARASRN